MGNDENNDEKKKGKKKSNAKNAPAASGDGKKNSKPAQFEAPSTSSK